MCYLIRSLKKYNIFDNVIELFINDKEVDAIFTQIIIENLMNTNNNKYKLLDLYRKMRNSKIDKNTHSLLIRHFSKEGKINQAIILLKEMVYNDI